MHRGTWLWWGVRYRPDEGQESAWALQLGPPARSALPAALNGEHLGEGGPGWGASGRGAKGSLPAGQEGG